MPRFAEPAQRCKGRARASAVGRKYASQLRQSITQHIHGSLTVVADIGIHQNTQPTLLRALAKAALTFAGRRHASLQAQQGNLALPAKRPGQSLPCLQTSAEV